MDSASASDEREVRVSETSNENRSMLLESMTMGEITNSIGVRKHKCLLLATPRMVKYIRAEALSLRARITSKGKKGRIAQATSGSSARKRDSIRRRVGTMKCGLLDNINDNIRTRGIPM